jgi:hypothetical protein
MIPHLMRPPAPPNTAIPAPNQDAAIVVCGGGDPFDEYRQARELCAKAGRNVTIFVGNDMIEKMPDDIEHACSLHPDKFKLWLPRRKANGYNDPPHIWAHRNYEGCVTEWTRDWAGSTGLFCTKVAREIGFLHVLLCGVPMTIEANHFVRQQPWNHALGFRKGWNAHHRELVPYVRSYGGWTQERFGAPTEEWLREDIVERHSVNRSQYNMGNSTGGLKA